MKLLVINPNTTGSVTELLHRHVAAAAGEGVTVSTATARFGAAYIADELSYAVAGHAALDAYAAFMAAQPEDVPDAVLLGCFGDPGVAALRQLAGVPVVGLAEAAMRQAAALGPYAIVTGGAAWAPMLRRLALGLGLAEGLVGIHTVAPSGAELAADPERALAILRGACIEAAQGGLGVRSVILGGAGLAGMALRLAADVPVPVIDSVVAGTEVLLQMAADAATSSPLLVRSAARWSGLSPELLASIAP
jgi:Asp/Glu/hydantoin racemase